MNIKGSLKEKGGEIIPYCPNCESQMNYIEQNNQWYCNNCQQYQEPLKEQLQYTRPPIWMSRRPIKSWIMPIILIIVSIVLLSISIAIPWYHFDINEKDHINGETYTSEGTIEYSIKGPKYEFDYPEVSLLEDEDETYDWDETNLDETENVFGVLNGLLITSIIILIIALILNVLSGQGFLSVNFGIIFIVIGLIFVLIIPIYFAIALPVAFKEDTDGGEFQSDSVSLKVSGFIGSDSDTFSEGDNSMKLSVSWYPTVGWFLSLIAMIIQCIVLRSLIAKKRNFPSPIPKDQHPYYTQPNQQYLEKQYPQQYQQVLSTNNKSILAYKLCEDCGFQNKVDLANCEECHSKNLLSIYKPQPEPSMAKPVKPIEEVGKLEEKAEVELIGEEDTEKRGLAIIKERLAKGEIDLETYRELKEELE